MSNKISAPDAGQSAKRNTSRDSLFLVGKLTFADVPRVFDVKIRNLSATGMMAECPAAVAPGHLVVIETKGLGEITGKVAWSAEGRIGIAFDLIIDPALARNPGKANGASEVMIPDYLKNLNTKRTTLR